MKTLPLIASFALLSTLTACTTIRSVEPTVPMTPASNNQPIGSDSVPAIPQDVSKVEGTPTPLVNSGVTQPSSSQTPLIPAKSTVNTAQSKPNSAPPSQPTTPSPTPASPVAPVTPTPQAKVENFSKTVTYSSPGGQEDISFSIETKDGIIASLVVTPKAGHPVSNSYQKSFANNAPSQVIGKSLSGLKISTVSGGSLTTKAFNEYVTGL